MKNLIWVGVRESEIKYSDFMDNSISIFGNSSNSLQNKIKKSINHNNEKNIALIDDFYNMEITKQIYKNSKVKFMYYSQIFSYYSMKKLGLLNFVICLNNQELIEFVDNKFEVKNYLKDYIPILNNILIKGKDIDLKKLQQKYGGGEFVLQTEKGSGGFSTIVLNEKSRTDIHLNKNQIYMLTKYCKNNIPVNIHLLISKNNIELLPISIQNIEQLHNRLMYKGCDFIAYRKFIDNKTNSKIKQHAYIIGELLQKKGYRGVLGIDFICYKDEVYFMEINPRFQNSSIILNRALQESNLPSLQELQYNCFFDKTINLRQFNVNYSSYINEFNEHNKEFEISPIEILDKFNGNIEFEKYSYLFTNIYNESIINF